MRMPQALLSSGGTREYKCSFINISNISLDSDTLLLQLVSKQVEKFPELRQEVVTWCHFGAVPG